MTTSSHPVAGCRSIPLGTMEYQPVIAPKLQTRFALGDRVDLTQCPIVVYNHKDDFQHNQLQGLSLTAEPPVHAVPSSEGYVRAVASGLGWGMVPSLQLTKERIAREGELIDVRELDTVNVPLYLQRWSIALPGLDRLEHAVRLAAASLGTDYV